MANCCIGDIFVYDNLHDNKNVEKFFERIKGSDEHGNELLIDFDKIVPEPDNLYDSADLPVKIRFNEKKIAAYAKKHKLESRRVWRGKHWGIQRSISPNDMEKIDDNGIVIDTPWAPPKPIIDKLWEIAQEYELHLEYEYQETGCQICGNFNDGVWTTYDDCKKCGHCECEEVSSPRTDLLGVNSEA
jgi:hypothetical protein